MQRVIGFPCPKCGCPDNKEQGPPQVRTCYERGKPTFVETTQRMACEHCGHRFRIVERPETEADRHPPIVVNCPECGSPQSAKPTRSGRQHHHCARCGCHFTIRKE